MDVTQQSKAALHGSADALGNAADKVKQGAGWMSDNAGDVVDSAAHGMKRAGYEISSFFTRRPVESGLLLAGIGCLLAGFFIGRSRYRDFL